MHSGKRCAKKPVYFLDIPFEERLAYLLQTYSGFEKEKYVNAVIRIQKRLGPLETRNTIGFYWKTIIPAPSEYYWLITTKPIKNRCITGKDSKTCCVSFPVQTATQTTS